jgi:serine/threonine protein phosphatase PrpC
VRCAILIATDGLYDMMSNERAVDLAFEHWGDPAAAAEELITETGNTHIFICIYNLHKNMRMFIHIYIYI